MDNKEDVVSSVKFQLPYNLKKKFIDQSKKENMGLIDWIIKTLVKACG